MHAFLGALAQKVASAFRRRGTGYCGNWYPRSFKVNCRREERTPVLAMASGRSANRRSISAGDFKWRSELRASRRPAVASVRWWRNAGEDVENFALLGLRVAHAIGGEQRQAAASARFRRPPGCALLPARRKMALQFDVHVFAAEYSQSSRTAFDAALRCHLARSACASGPSSPPVRQIRPAAFAATSSGSDVTFAFLRAQFHAA